MATKPSDTFTVATDATFSSGPDAGNNTKVNPPGYPAVAQGFVPGTKAIAAYVNKLWNVVGQWLGWLLAGSSAGAADAHIVETDANGDTKVQNLALTETLGGTIRFDDAGTGAGGYAIATQTIAGTGTTPGGDLTIVGQAGQAQTGGSDNNDGGEIAVSLGVKGTGGSGTGARGFGGQARHGRMRRGVAGIEIHEWFESFDLGAAAAATKVLNLDVADRQLVMLRARLTMIKSGGGAGLTYHVQERAWAVKREGTTLTIAGPDQTVDEANLVNGDISVTDPGDGTVDVNVSGAQVDATQNHLWVEVTYGRVSA